MRRGVILTVGGCLFWALTAYPAAGSDWPQWGGSDGRNMVSDERGLPERFVAGQKSPDSSGIDLATTENVVWATNLGTMTCASPAVAGGRIFIGACRRDEGAMLCLSEKTGAVLWQWNAPPKEAPKTVNGQTFWFHLWPGALGVCSSPAVDGERVYFVSHRCEVVCLDVHGSGAAGNLRATATAAKELWSFDMWALGVRPSDACSSSVLVYGDLVYACTSNGVDRNSLSTMHSELCKPPAPLAPSLIALDKRTGRLAAVDDEQIGTRLLHGQWSSPSLGRVGDKTLVFFGAGDGVCYAFEALAAVPERPIKLKKVWSFDCNPPEYKQFGTLDPISHYCLGDCRRADTLNAKNDGSFAGMSEIVATPVFYKNRVYVALGRDPEHGRGRGALWCIDATKIGDITASGKIWCYRGLDRTLSTVAIADGLLYVGDVAGRLHCLDAETGRCYWVYEAKAETWGSPLAADGKIYFPTQKCLWVLAAGKQLKVHDKITVGAPIWATPVAANGRLYVASTRYLWAVQSPGADKSAGK